MHAIGRPTARQIGARIDAKRPISRQRVIRHDRRHRLFTGRITRSDQVDAIVTKRNACTVGRVDGSRQHTGAARSIFDDAVETIGISFDQLVAADIGQPRAVRRNVKGHNWSSFTRDGAALRSIRPQAHDLPAVKIDVIERGRQVDRRRLD